MRRGLVATLLVVGSVLTLAGPATAVPRPNPPGTPRGGSNTDLTFTATGPGQGVTGYIATSASTFDPLTGYPAAANPPGPNFNALNEGFAGILLATSPGGTPNSIRLYCIDIETNTYTGIGYQQGTWSASNVANVGYVAQILNSYYPTVAAQPPVADVNARAAAVQAAIWFFSDRYVLNANDSLRPTVEAIVADVLAKDLSSSPRRHP